MTEHPAFELIGKVEAVLITDAGGVVASDDYGGSLLTTKSVPKVQVIRDHGVRGDRHAGPRLLDVREKELRAFGLPKGMEISNHRQFSAASVEELADIASAMQLSRQIPHGSLGENLVVSGIPRFTELPIGTLLFFRKNEREPRTAVLVVWSENMPCQGPGEAIQCHFPDQPGLVTAFPKAAIGKRGVVGSVYASGVIARGDEIVVKVPLQRIYSL